MIQGCPNQQSLRQETSGVGRGKGGVRKGTGLYKTTIFQETLIVGGRGEGEG